MFKLQALVILGVTLFGAVSRIHGATTVVVDGTASHDIAPLLYGLMYEDINSGDGGLYGELLQNRAFQQVTPGSSAALNAWHAVNSATLNVVRDSTPVSASLPNALQVTFPSGSNAGFSNEGYWGIKIDSSWTYTASLYYRFPSASDFSSQLTLGLKNAAGETVASTSVPVQGSQTSWTQVKVTFKPNSSQGSVGNQFFVTLDNTSGSAQTVNFAMLSLFPPTYKDRPNGMRIDIAEALVELGPSFFRFPGGNNLGEVAATRWQWNTTVGSLLDRPGRQGDWGYINTDGLGILEYLEFFEDTNMEPIMAVWDGYALASGGSSVPPNQLGPYVQQAIDQINFVIGDPSKSAPAALRASLGHPEPFKLKYIEIGNEDNVGSAPSTVQGRWQVFANALKAEFPQLRFIATSAPWRPTLNPVPTDYDVHVYQTPTWFAQNSFFYDDFQRNGTQYFEGEYAAISTNPNNIFGSPANGRLLWPTMHGAAGEAAFMTGFERNSDIVFAAAYAPLLQHVNGTQWTPNLISFDSGSVIRSASFYVQKLFSLNRGDEYLPSTLPARTGPTFWSVTRSKSSGEIIIKVSNVVATASDLTFELPFDNVASSGSLELLAGAQSASNTPGQPEVIQPVTSTIATGKTFNFTAPAYSVSVIRFKAS